MTEPDVPMKSPCAVEVKSGETYWWCSCGRSSNQPHCDGSHKGTDFAPREFAADKDDTVWFCGCKHTGTPPMCDGSHNDL